jgi:hypothetical protein
LARRGSLTSAEGIPIGLDGPSQGLSDARLQPGRELLAAALSPDDVLEAGAELLPLQASIALVQMPFDWGPGLSRYLFVDVPLDEVQDLAAVNL